MTFEQLAIDDAQYVSEKTLELLKQKSRNPPLFVNAQNIGAIQKEASRLIDGLVCGWGFDLGQTQLQQLPGLRYIGLRCTSTQRVDMKQIEQREIICKQIFGYGDQGTVEFVVEALLSLFREHTKKISGQYAELYEKTLAIIGYGEIGRRVASIASAMGVRVLVCARRPLELPESAGIKQVPLDLALRTADAVSFHTPAYTQILNAEQLAMLKSDARIVLTTLGIPFPASDFVAFMKRNPHALAVLDQCAASTSQDKLGESENIIIKNVHAARTHESIQRAEDFLLRNIDAFSSRYNA